MAGRDKRLVGKRIADRYCITGEIGKGGMGVVYRAIPFDEPSQSVAIKVIQRSGRLGYEDLMRFQKEASLMAQLHHPNIVVFHELGLFGRSERGDDDDLGSGYYIVMEIADGTNLKESLARDGRKDLSFLFQVGLQVSAALDYTHGKGIIHRDIKPHNIIVGQTFRDQRSVLVKVLDFGVARLAEAINYGLVKDTFQPRIPGIDEAAGTPLYMAPEQTRFLDAPIDHRVDLYSLGCVLYELLTGKPPFSASTRERLERQHVYSDPEPVSYLRPDVPILVEKIVHKLLAKHPSERYQTAFGLHADLLRARSIFEKKNVSPTVTFPLGLKDRFQAVSAQLKMVGRQKEFQTLVTEFEAVIKEQGRSRLALVKGAAGIGKSRLLHEFQSYLSRRKVKFITAQFSQHENALPFNALANGFNEYLYRTMKGNSHEAQEIKQRIKQTLGPTAHSIAEVVPGLKPYIADISEEEVDVVGGADSENINQSESFATFAKAFSDFTRCLGTNNQPIAFIFHDLHWADEKSLDLIDVFFSNANANGMGFFLLVSQRTDSHLSNLRCDRFLEKFSKLKRRFTKIELDRIQKDVITEIVGNMLMSSRSVSSDLVNFLDEQSRGNPMHLVELTRTLVARNYIAIKTFGGDWEYDMIALRAAQIKLNTVDLILSRMGEYDEFERKILSIAATVGITFQFEIILIESRINSVPAINTIQKAIEEGLIIRITDDKDLKHLGKSYMFTHKKARDAIYESMDVSERRRLHRAIGEKIEQAISQPSGKVLFSLAHHFNAAMDNGNTDDIELAKRSLTYNRLAGAAAKQIGSWQTAERYYENADRIMGSWMGKISTDLDKVVVKETLGDLASLQRRHGQALKVYRELLDGNLPLENYANIAYKSIYFQIVGGIISESEQLLRQALKKLSYSLGLFGFFQRLKILLNILFERWRQKATLSKYLGVLAHAAQKAKKNSEEQLESRYPIIRLLSLAQLIQLYENKNVALVYHHAAMVEALAGRGSANNLIRVVAEHAAILGADGGTRVAYRLFDAALDISKKLRLKSTYGYVCLIRALTLDYIKGRQEELSHHLHDSISLLKLSHDDRLAYSQAMVFKIFRELTRCNFPGLYRYCQMIPEIVPTRSLLAPRSMALMLFGYLLQGSRNNVVRHGELFMKRRHAVSGRDTDLFVKVVNTIIAFARGEVEKTRETFLNFLGVLFKGQNIEFLFPYELDFLGIFSFVFPLLYEQEYGRKLLRDDERKIFLFGFSKILSSSMGKNGAVSLLLIARSQELLGQKSKVRVGYDSALKTAKESGNNLVQILAYLWFGTHLIDLGNKNRREFLRRAFIMSQKCEMNGIMLLIRKVLEKRKIYLPEIAVAEEAIAKKEISDNPLQSNRIPLNMLNLQFISEAVESDTSLISNLQSSFKILDNFYKFDRVRCLAVNKIGQLTLVFPAPEQDNGVGQTTSENLIKYVEPYFNIKSTLFVPYDDAPWNSKKGSSDAAGGETIGVDSESTFEAQDTLIIATEDSSLGAVRTLSLDEEDNQGSSLVQRSQNKGPANEGTDRFPEIPRPEKMLMSALVPIRSNNKSLGVIFMENIAQTLARDTTYSRLELDHFGAQMGVLFEQKNGYFSSADRSQKGPGQTDSGVKPYQPGQYSLEPVNWLKLWHSGRLRAQRETVWYLGLNFGPDHYVVCYTHLAGIEQIREKFGSMVWNHFFVLRTLAQAGGKRHIDMSDFYDELVGFFRFISKTVHLEGISIAVSIFSREEKTVYSGHFGPARPYVLGVENIVTPSNDIVMTFFNGRDLRYWEVEADLRSHHAYVLSYDTSRLDSIATDLTRKKLSQQMERPQTSDEYHRALAQVVEIGLLPRYYLGAVLLGDQIEREGKNMPKLDKAQ